MRRLLAVSLCLSALALASCGDSTHQNAPDPTPSNIINGTNTHVIQEPDGFRNVSFACWDSTGIYVTSRGSDVSGSITSAVAVILNDPHCKGGYGR